MYAHLPTHNRRGRMDPRFPAPRVSPWEETKAFQPGRVVGSPELITTDPVLRRMQRQRGLQIGLREMGLGQEPSANIQMLQSLEAELQQKMKRTMGEIAANMEEEVKEAQLKTAAIQTGVSLALAAVPVVGWAASAIVSVAAAIGGSKYQGEAEQIMADAKNQVARLQAESQARIRRMMTQAFEEEKPQAIELAISGAPLEGFGSFIKRTIDKVGDELSRFGRRLERETEFIRDPIQDFGRSIEKEADRFEERIQEEVIDPLVGRTVKLEAREARGRIVREAKAKLAEHEANVRALIESPQYRVNLRLQLAKQLRANPLIQEMIQDRLAIEMEKAQIANTTPGMPSPDGTTRAASKVPLMVAAGAAAWALLS